MKFSACWIVKDEAHNIKKSILSVKDCCDELIVVDTGSVDDTVRIAQKCGAKTKHFKWINDFSAAKNYALSLATGDYVIFLDGDEYFEPHLTIESGQEFHQTFENSGADTLRIPRYEMERTDGSLKGIQLFDRILRRGAVHYENKVHEIPRREGGQEVRFSLMGSYKLVHTGYSLDLIEEKASRNIAILESERNRLQDPAELLMNAAYLMREYMILRDNDRACDCCLYLLRHHKHLKDVCSRYHRGFLQRFYQAIHVVDRFPHRFSRKEVYDKLFGGIKENYPDTRDAAIADLHYMLRFEYREDRFLREIIKTEPKLEELPRSESLDCRQAESDIFERAAEAAHMRRDPERTLRWALHALQHAQTYDSRPLQLMFYWLRGNPPDLFAAYICELVDMENPDIASIVMTILGAEEYREVYKLLLKKGAPKAPDAELHRIGQGIVGAEGPARSDAFRLRAELANSRMKYADIANDPDAEYAAFRCVPCACHVAHANLMMGEHEKAYDALLPHLDDGDLDRTLLGLLLAIADTAGGDLTKEAGKRYNESQSLLDEGAELSDVINTEAVYKADAKAERRKMKNMTVKAFFGGLENDATRPVTHGLLEMHERAAAVFEGHGCLLRAALSHRLLLAKTWNRKRSAEHLERLFRECGNETLAKQIAAYASVWK